MIINVKAYPNSSKNNIIKLNEKEFEVYVKSSPENNKANFDIINLLSKYFNIGHDRIKIKRGAKSNKKEVSIDFNGNKISI